MCIICVYLGIYLVVFYNWSSSIHLATSFDRTFSTEQKSRLQVLEPIQLPTRAISKRKPVSWSYVKRAMPNLHQSLFVNRERLLMDLGLFQAKQFRIGWGPQWKLVHGGKLLNDSESYLGSGW